LGWGTHRGPCQPLPCWGSGVLSRSLLRPPRGLRRCRAGGSAGAVVEVSHPAPEPLTGARLGLSPRSPEQSRRRRKRKRQRQHSCARASTAPVGLCSQGDAPSAGGSGDGRAGGSVPCERRRQRVFPAGLVRLWPCPRAQASGKGNRQPTTSRCWCWALRSPSCRLPGHAGADKSLPQLRDLGSGQCEGGVRTHTAPQILLPLLPRGARGCPVTRGFVRSLRGVPGGPCAWSWSPAAPVWCPKQRQDGAGGLPEQG